MWYLVPLVMCGSMVGRIHRPNKGGPLVSWGPGSPSACPIGVTVPNLTEASFGAGLRTPSRSVAPHAAAALDLQASQSSKSHMSDVCWPTSYCAAIPRLHRECHAAKRGALTVTGSWDAWRAALRSLASDSRIDQAGEMRVVPLRGPTGGLGWKGAAASFTASSRRKTAV